MLPAGWKDKRRGKINPGLPDVAAARWLQSPTRRKSRRCESEQENDIPLNRKRQNF